MLNIRFFWLTLLCMLMAIPAMAQRSRFKPQKHEIGIEALSIAQVPVFSESYTGLPGSLSTPSGLRYKYFLTMEDGLRAGGFRQVTHLSQGNVESAEREGYRFQIGYERNMVFGASRIFAGADAIVGLGTVDFSQVDPSTSNTLEGTEGYTSYGLNPFFGYRLYFSPYVSTTLELGGYYLAHRYDENLVGAEEGAFLYPTQEWGMRGAVSLSFHFGKLKKRCTCPRF